MSFPALKLTAAGLTLQARALQGETLNFCAIAMGDGEYSGDIEPLTGLVSTKVTMDLVAISRKNAQVTIEAQFVNTGLAEGFWWREIGVFADDPDTEGGRILYAYQNAGELAEYIASAGSEAIEKDISVAVISANAENVTATLDSQAYVRRPEFEDHINDRDNPHETTAQMLVTPLAVTRTLELYDWIPAQLADTSDVKKITISDLKRLISVAVPTIAVTSCPDAAITAVCGEETITGTGSAFLSLPCVGTWTVTASYNGLSKSATVEVTGAIRYDVVLQFTKSLVLLGQTTEFYYGDRFVFDGTATANYYGGATEDVTGQITLDPASGTALTTMGANTVTATFDGVSATYTVTVRQKLLENPAQSGELYYTGSAQEPAFSNYDPATLTIGGDTSGTATGSYEATFAITDAEKYAWADGSSGTKTVVWTIAGKSVAGLTVTPAEGLVYTGALLTNTPTVLDGSTALSEGIDYTVTGNTTVNAGTYAMTITGCGNYAGEVSVRWTVAKAAGSISASPETLTITGSAGTTGVLTVTRAGDGNITASSSNTKIATAVATGVTVTVTSVASGSCTVTLTVGEGTNHLGASCTIAVTTALDVRFSYTGGYSLSGDTLTLTSSGTLTLSDAATVTATLGGAGGGGGGADSTGGGGGYAGSIKTTKVSLFAQSYSAYVGSGGSGGNAFDTYYSEANPTDGSSGSSTSFAGVSAAGGAGGTLAGGSSDPDKQKAPTEAGRGGYGGWEHSSSSYNRVRGTSGASLAINGVTYCGGTGGDGTGSYSYSSGGNGGRCCGGGGGGRYYRDSDVVGAGTGVGGYGGAGGDGLIILKLSSGSWIKA